MTDTANNRILAEIDAETSWEFELPIYEYQCTGCGAVRDIKHGFKETTAETCAVCGSSLQRLFKPAGIVFKGSGFYVNDSRKPASEAKADSKSEAAPKPDAKPDSKTEVKSAKSGTGDAAA